MSTLFQSQTKLTFDTTTQTRIHVSSRSRKPRCSAVEIRPSKPRPADPGLASTWAHRAWVGAGSIALLGSLSRAGSSQIWLEPALTGVAGYLLADLASGVYHWGIDNYGDASTPVFGPQIEAFQGHHRRPRTITRREFANNLHSLGRVTALAVLPVDLFCPDPSLHGFVFAFAGFVMFSQQFHAWAHSDRAQVPGPVARLQDLGLLVGRAHHGAHHREPYNTNYCIVSGVWNGILDKMSVFQAMEMVIFFRFGLRPRSWTEPDSDWTEETDDSLTV